MSAHNLPTNTPGIPPSPTGGLPLAGPDTPLDPAIRIHNLTLEKDISPSLETALQAQLNAGELECDPEMLATLPAALEQGRGRLSLALWNNRRIVRIQPGEASTPLGLAVDLGSTTLTAVLCDLINGDSLAYVSAANPQRSCGTNIISRITYAVQPGGLTRLQALIHEALNTLAYRATARIDRSTEDILDLVLVGNSVMHHLALGLDPRTLGQAPFIPVTTRPFDLPAAKLGLQLNPEARVHSLPLIGGHVGADTVAVLLAEAPHRRDENTLILNLGTNGEIVLGNRHRLLCASATTGPALDGAGITHGMPAFPGAIERVRINPTTLEVRYQIVGDPRWSNAVPPGTLIPRGICGSGLIDAVAEMLDTGLLHSSGRFTPRAVASPHHRHLGGQLAFVLAEPPPDASAPPIIITQRDIRVLQMAKAALYTSARLLLQQLGLTRPDRIVLSGAFGSALDPDRARRLGLFPGIPPQTLHVVGNAALAGARLALLNCATRREAEALARRVELISAPTAASYQDQWVAALPFPS